MKKLLLSVATALLSTAAVCAQDLPQIYIIKDVVSSPDQLKNGAYVINAYHGNITSSVVNLSDNSNAALFGASYQDMTVPGNKGRAYVWAESGYVWDVNVNNEKKFTLQNVSNSKYFSCKGSAGTDNFPYSAKNNIQATTGSGNTPITTPGLLEFNTAEIVNSYATIEIEEAKPVYGENATEEEIAAAIKAAEDKVKAEANTKQNKGLGLLAETRTNILNAITQAQEKNQFYLHLTNAQFSNNNAAGGSKIGYPCLYVNTSGNNRIVSYWGNGLSDYGGLTFMFTLAELATEDDFIDIEVTLPEWTGTTITKTVKCLKDANATHFIAKLVEEMGGINNLVIKSANEGGDLIATADNKNFVVEGDWNCDFEPYEAYRVVLSPNEDGSTALRYMIQDENIRTRLDADAKASVARIVPERLWYFDPVEDEPMHFYMRTLYDTSKGVTYTEPYANGQAAQLTENPTKLELVSKDELVQDGVHYPQFFMKIADSDNFYMCDYEGELNTAGTLKLYQNPADNDEGSLFRLYPLSAVDKQMIGLEANADAVVTNEQFMAAVTAWNDQNVRAALRRIEYWGSKNLIGNNPGQINNPAGNLVEKYAEAQEVAANLDNGSEQYDTDYLNELTAALDWQTFSVNEVLLNHFYRFKNVSSGKYMSSIINGTYGSITARMQLTDDAARSNTVFYYTADEEGNRMLVSFDNGLVVSKFDSNTKIWTPVVSTHDHAAKKFEIIVQEGASFILHADGDKSANTAHRHLHGAGTTVDCGDFRQDNDGYHWYVENVDELPLTFYNLIDNDPTHGDDGWASICSPVAIKIPAGSHITAYVGQHDDTDYSEVSDLNHVLATQIEPDEDGNTLIPAGQIALLFYDGEYTVGDNDFLDESLMENRQDITYATVPLVYGDETAAQSTNIKGSYLAFTPEADKEYYTLHASYNNYFRKYSQYAGTTYPYVPGFKAYLALDKATSNEVYYQVSTINPNTMVPQVTGTEGTQGIAVEKAGESQHKVTITMPDENYVVYYKHTPFEAAEENQPQQVRRRAAAEGFEEAEKSGNEHTFTKGPGAVEYYAYHTPTNTTSAVRSFDLTTEGEAMPTSIKSVMVNMNGKQVIFDLQGRRMAAPVKGINIVNNKKVLVK